jgi:hypothetical protein
MGGHLASLRRAVGDGGKWRGQKNIKTIDLVKLICAAMFLSGSESNNEAPSFVENAKKSSIIQTLRAAAAGRPMSPLRRSLLVDWPFHGRDIAPSI